MGANLIVGSGWIFWTAKTESSPYWDFLQLVQGGIFPQPFTDRQFPGQVSGLWDVTDDSVDTEELFDLAWGYIYCGTGRRGWCIEIRNA